MSAIGIDDIEGLLGVAQYEEVGEFPVEQGYVWTTCSSVENGNPLFWDPEVAEEVTGGPIAPPTMVSVWFRPHHWAPNRSTPGLPLQIHFDLKEGLGLPEAVMSDNTIVFYEPVRPGDLLRTSQILKSVSDEKTTKLGTGRFWVIDVEYHNQRGDLVAVESYTGFGDKEFAVTRNGTRDIFLNTPNLASWFERYITDWTGPFGRLQRVTFRMKGSIFPGDTMVFRGVVADTGVDDTGCGWAALEITVSVDGDTKTSCTARVALPVSDGDNPWSRAGDRWVP